MVAAGAPQRRSQSTDARHARAYARSTSIGIPVMNA